MTNLSEKKNYDSEFCGSLPLHLINMVQSYGVLMILSKSDLKIGQVSENIHDMLGIAPEDAVKTSFDQFIPAAQAENFRNKFSTGITGKLPFTFDINTGNGHTQQYLGIVHEKNDYLLLELEKNNKEPSTFIDMLQELRFAMAQIDKATSTEEICNTAIKALKQLSGFDKVMIYQFDEDWNGTTIAEVSEPGMTEYLGLRFPASDIPKQARDLYLKNPYRLIPNREYKPVKLYPVINPLTTTFLDLSECNLRGVPAVHLEYLKNMGVMSSMSTRIIRDGKLWGLISCHHRTAKHLDYEMCSMFDLLSNIISARIATVQDQEVYRFSSKLKETQASLMQQVYDKRELAAGIFNSEVSVLDLLNAGGAALISPAKIRTVGNVPTQEQIREMTYWLQGNPSEDVVGITNVSDLYEPGQQFSDVASGMIVIPIDQEKGEYIIGFRPEVVQEVNWGGNPNEAINFEKDNVTYHPRNSFKQWQQVVKNTSVPWQPAEIAIAKEFRDFVVKNR